VKAVAFTVAALHRARCAYRAEAQLSMRLYGTTESRAQISSTLRKLLVFNGLEIPIEILSFFVLPNLRGCRKANHPSLSTSPAIATRQWKLKYTAANGSTVNAVRAHVWTSFIDVGCLLRRFDTNQAAKAHYAGVDRPSFRYSERRSRSCDCRLLRSETHPISPAVERS
jgi:hypothetical protein